METLLSFFGRKKTPFTAAPTPSNANSFSQVNPRYSNVESALAKADKLSLEVVKNYKHRNTKKLNSNIRQLKNLVNAKYIGKDYFNRSFSRNSASMSELDDEELGYIKFMMERDGVFNSFKGGKTRRRKARKSKTRRH
jgi:hypothetical protein